MENMLDKKVLGRAKSRQIETDEEWNARRYNNRSNYRRRLAKLSPEELKKKRDEDRCRIAKRRQNATDKQRDKGRLNNVNRIRMRKWGNFYSRQTMDREQSRRNFEEAKRHKLLPKHLDFSRDTGSWPFITHIYH
jgi:hypothetical protein